MHYLNSTQTLVHGISFGFKGGPGRHGLMEREDRRTAVGPGRGVGKCQEIARDIWSQINGWEEVTIYICGFAKKQDVELEV